MRSWFRHDANMRHDPAVSRLGREFGPIGILAWTHLLEACCDRDGTVQVLVADVSELLGLRSEWGPFDLRLWLRRASQLGLITCTFRSRAVPSVQIAVANWSVYNPPYERKDAIRARKARSRAKSVTVTSPLGHSDVTVTSQRTDIQYEVLTRARAPEPVDKAATQPTAGRLPVSETTEQAEARARELGLLPEPAVTQKGRLEP